MVSNVDHLYNGEETRTRKHDYRLQLLEGVTGTAPLYDKQRQILRFPLDTVGPYGLAKLTLNVQSAAGIKLKRESWLQRIIPG